MTHDSDLVLIGIGEAGYGMREPTTEELAAYEASKTNEFKLDATKLRQAIADKARLETMGDQFGTCPACADEGHDVALDCEYRCGECNAAFEPDEAIYED